MAKPIIESTTAFGRYPNTVGNDDGGVFPAAPPGIRPDLDRAATLIDELLVSQAKHGQASGSTRQGQADVLIVDDDPVLVDSLRELLREEGYEAEGFTDARAALDCLLAGARPSVLLLDYIMPVMSGDQFLDALDAAGIALHVVLFTAMHESALESPISRVTSVIRKPFDLEPLLETIGRIARN